MTSHTAALPEVIRKIYEGDANDWTSASFDSTLKIFVTMKQDRAETMTLLEADSDATPSYSALRSRMDDFMMQCKQHQKEAYKARVAKRALLGAQASSAAVSKPSNMFATVGKPSSVNASTCRPWYSAKVSHGARRTTSLTPQRLTEEVPAPVKPQIHDHLERKQTLGEMMWEHPTVTLDLGDLKENVEAVVSDSGTSQAIIGCVQEAVREASSIKRKGQELIGKYIQAVFYPRPAPGEQRPKDPLAVANSTDMTFPDQLCPRLVSKELAKDDEHDNDVEDGHGEGKRTHFLQTFLTLLYLGNMPSASSPGVAAVASSFIRRLQDLDLLPKSDKPKLSAELKRRYKYGCKALAEKMAAMIKKDRLSNKDEIKLNDKVPVIELFLRLDNLTGNKWTIAPLSPVEDGWLTFTEAELDAFFYRKIELHPALEMSIHLTGKRVLAQEDLARDWLRGQEPGSLIRRLIAFVAPDALPSKEKRKGIFTAPVEFLTPDGIRDHINGLRTADFDPRAYTQKGYLLCGSVKTDGHRLQVLAFKLRELLPVRYKRYNSDLLLDRLLSTAAGTDDHLAEARNVFKTKKDVERLLGSIADQVAPISYLGIDPGQSCVVDAVAIVGAASEEAEVASREAVSVARSRRAVEPTSTESSTEAEELSISKIETKLPPLRGEQADFGAYVQHRNAHKNMLDTFYNGNNFKFKRYKWYAKAAREEEYHRLMNALLSMVSGSIGAKKKDEDKVIIGVGLSRFKFMSRLSSLHYTFMTYFAKKVTFALFKMTVIALL
ncbi:hypothetical protein BGZ51_001195 [Haplosporangium sp. Z 767]|nr:hypothetical protein BGZ51_001195 [Haplosporangium sp. Z 767]